MAYTQAQKLEIMQRVCDAVADGENLMRICNKDGIPPRKTIYQWLIDDADLSDAYARARKTRADSRADRIDEIAQKALSGAVDPHAARLAIDADKWLASKENQGRYGDNVHLQHTGADGGPVVLEWSSCQKSS